MKLKMLLTCVVLLTTLAFTSCTKEKIDENIYDIEYKLTGSEATIINIIQMNTNDDGGTLIETYTDDQLIFGYKSDVFRLKERNALIVVHATGANASSTLKAEIFKNGALAKEYTQTGTALSLELGLP
ncbi:hypothetical protein ABDK00_004990 [Niabella insulamsoli]|uniref:hypothetical protein n=1 Tax=Niabella insulamsoli TaxID=3144874 RepID=UPI0031FC7CD5